MSPSSRTPKPQAVEPSETVISQTELLSRCVLFARVEANPVGHTRVSNPSEQAHAIERCLKRMRRAAEAFGGRNFKPGTDGVLALFVDADSALQTACEMRQRVEDLPPTAGIKLSSRIGLDVGMLVADDDETYGECVDNAKAISGLAGPGQIYAGVDALQALSPALAQLARPVGLAKTGTKPLQVFEFVCAEVSDCIVKAPLALNRAPQTRLILTIGNDSTTVSAKRKLRTIGRDIGNDLAVAEPRASRTHARVEMRGDSFVVIDVSRNGTFISLGGGRQIVLRKEEMELPEQGLISLGRPCAPDAHCVSFEIVR